MEIRKIKYIGSKEVKSDTVCGTGLVWKRGKVLNVELSVARSLLKYPTVWQDVTKPGKDAGIEVTGTPINSTSTARKLQAEADELSINQDLMGNGGMMVPPSSIAAARK